MKIEGLDHLVLTVKDIDATCKFYVKVLGMENRYLRREPEGAILWLSEDQPATTRPREHSTSATADTRLSRCLLHYDYSPFRRYRPLECLRCKRDGWPS